MLTLNQFKIILTGFFENHLMVNSVYYLDDFDFNAVIDLQYPAVNIEYLDSSISNKIMYHNYKIVIGDITLPDNSDMEDMIYSDALQVAEDFFTYIQNYNGNLLFDRSSSIKKFYNDMPDRVCGIVFTVRLGTIRAMNDCSTPLKN